MDYNVNIKSPISQYLNSYVKASNLILRYDDELRMYDP